MNKTYRIAIVGSGPSGFYAAEALLKSELTVSVDMYERLPSPFGLVRYGVAPDHPMLKKPIAIYEKIAQHDNFRLLANVNVGTDISIDELRAHYDAVLVSFGAQSDRALGVDGENLESCHSATEFVGWYNGHPDFRDLSFNLQGQSAVIIGHGNVSADLVRILLKSPDELTQTDIADHALAALRNNHIREVHIVGRRGPAQAKFGNKELRELGELADVDVIVSQADMELNAATVAELEDRANFAAKKNVEMFAAYASAPPKGAAKKLYFHFLCSPQRVLGDQRVEGVDFAVNALSGDAGRQRVALTGVTKTIPCDIVFKSVGYLGVGIDGLPFDTQQGVIPNDNGRVSGAPGTYVAGWIKRGPSGTIGSNRACALETVAALLADLQEGVCNRTDDEDALTLLLSRRVRVVDYTGWEKIDRAECDAGAAIGKPREKFTRVAEMLALLE